MVKFGDCPIDFQNQTTRPTFFKNVSQLHRRSRVFLSPNLRLYFFFLNKFILISYIKLKAISQFISELFFFGRIRFNGITYIKLKVNCRFLIARPTSHIPNRCYLERLVWLKHIEDFLFNGNFNLLVNFSLGPINF